MDPMQSRASISTFNIPIKGTAKYKGIDKNGKITKEIDSDGKFASRTVKKLKNASDEIDKFFHLKSKDFADRRISARKAQKTLTERRAKILANYASSPKKTIESLYNLTKEATTAGIKRGKLDEIIDKDVETLLTYQINNATSVDALKTAYEGFYANKESMTQQMIVNLDKQITKRFKRMANRLENQLNKFDGSTFNSVSYYNHTKDKCILINSVLVLAETIKHPNGSNLVKTYRDNLRELMKDTIINDFKEIRKKLKSKTIKATLIKY